MSQPTGTSIEPDHAVSFVVPYIRNVDEARNALRLLFQSTTNEQIARTAYGLVQAAQEYLDHVRAAQSWETRLNRTLMRSEPFKHRALSLAREITTA
jgi:hypothetical protein